MKIAVSQLCFFICFCTILFTLDFSADERSASSEEQQSLSKHVHIFSKSLISVQQHQSNQAYENDARITDQYSDMYAFLFSTQVLLMQIQGLFSSITQLLTAAQTQTETETAQLQNRCKLEMLSLHTMHF